MENRNWKEYRFSDFVDINPSVQLKANEEYSFVEMKDLEDGNKYCFPKIKKVKGGGAKFQNSDTLFARITPCLENGKICQVKGLENNLGFGSTEFYVFRGKDEISDTEFIYYLSRWREVRDHAEINLDGTSGRQRVPKASFDDLIIQMPELPEQKAIASVLSSLDDKIDLLHRQNATLEQMAETLFRQWFVEEVKEDWEEVTLGSLIDIFGGYSYKGNKIGQGSSYLLGMGCVSYSDRFLYSGMRKYDEEVNNKYLVEKGDIVIATRQQSDNLPILGAPAIIPEIDKNYKVIVGTNLYKVVNNSNLNYYSLYRLLKSSEYKNFIKSNAKGSTVRMITKDAILSFPILLPPNNTVNKINNELSSLNNKIELNNNQVQVLTHLRDTLLPKLMSGEVRVKM